MVFLEELWRSKDCPIDEDLESYRIRMSQHYSATKDLSDQETKIVNHYSFTKTVKILRHLEDVKSYVLTLLALEGLFNEKYLAALLCEYLSLQDKKMFHFTLKGVEAYSLDTLELKTTFLYKLDPYNDFQYYKGKFYFGKSLDEDDENGGYSKQVFCLDCYNGREQHLSYPEMWSAAFKMVGNKIYYYTATEDLVSVNLDDGKVTTILSESDAAEDFHIFGNLLYLLHINVWVVYDISNEEKVVALKYRETEPPCGSRSITVTQDRIYDLTLSGDKTTFTVYDNKTLNVLFVKELNNTQSIIEINKKLYLIRYNSKIKDFFVDLYDYDFNHIGPLVCNDSIVAIEVTPKVFGTYIMFDNYDDLILVDTITGNIDRIRYNDSRGSSIIG
jgi:hypothetical protein